MAKVPNVISKEMGMSSVFDTMDLEYPPESPPNYPPFSSWTLTQGLDPVQVTKIWKDSNLRLKGVFPVIYVHVPFCQYICKFCGFYRKIPAGREEIRRYLGLLKKEVSYFREAFKKIEIRWLCFGGGTPSMLEEEELDYLTGIFRSNFNITGRTGIAMEASPQTLTPEKVSKLKAIGVNYLSVGIQSFDEKLNRNLGRPQTEKECLQALLNAKRAGIENVEADLIVGLPGQTREIFLEDVKKLAPLDLERVYLFDYQPRSFTCSSVKSPSLKIEKLEEARKWRSEGIDFLVKNGYLMRCGHWVYKRGGGGWPYTYDQQEDDCYSIIGFGPTAISYCRDGLRSRNVSSLSEYGKLIEKGKLPFERYHFLSKKDEMLNFIIISLIHRGQFSEADFIKRFGSSPEKYFPSIFGSLEKEGFIFKSEGNFVMKNRDRAILAIRTAFHEIENLKDSSEKKRLPDGKNFLLDDILFLEKKNETSLVFSEIRKKRKEYSERLVLFPEKGFSSERLLELVRLSKKAGFRRTGLFYPYDEGESRLHKKFFAAGVSEMYFKLNEPRDAGIPEPLKSVKKSPFPETRFCIFINEKNIGKFSSFIHGWNVRARMLVIFPDYSRPAVYGIPRLTYSEFKKIIPGIAALSKRENMELKVLNAMPCVLYPRCDMAFSFLNLGKGDARESDKNIVKLHECLSCRELLKCPGPAREYLEKFGLGDIKAVL